MMSSLMKSLKRSIPSILTMLNLLSGCIAILLSFHDLALAGLMILLAGVLDFADGLAARLLDAYSDFGKELDSLADMVSFGVAPSFILFHLLQISLIMDPMFSVNQMSVNEVLILSGSFLPALFASLRLAKFNLENKGQNVFSGLPSPASGIFFASAGYILLTTDVAWVKAALMNTGLLMALNIGISTLMIIPLPMFNIKFRNFRLAGNKIRYLFALPSLFMVIYFGLQSIPVIILYYILLSVIIFLIPATRHPAN
jgi:CDP-diacylglycerol---serine O-phosphatidyltransferase